MPTTKIPKHVHDILIQRQQDEITEYHIYSQLARRYTGKNRQILADIAAMERRHYEHWKTYTGKEVPPNGWKVRLYLGLARLLGMTFALRLMERGEQKAQSEYQVLLQHFPEADAILREEMEHEDQLVELIEEDIVAYLSSIILGLNDALVELTGALAGLTLALQNTPLIALSGLIIGFSAAMSMAVSEYLSTKAEKDTSRQALRAALYTGLAYIGTVIVLVFPYLVVGDPFISLALSLGLSLMVVAAFSFYRSVLYQERFLRNFLEMALLSLGVAAISFVAGYVLRQVFGIEVD